MKAWQLTFLLAALAAAAGLLPDIVADDARLDRVIRSSELGMVGPEDLPPISLSAIDSTVRAQRSVKQCFFEAQQRDGLLSDVVVRFRILPSGAVETASVSDPAALQGSRLDACLSQAFENIQFAPTSGNGVWLNYPFKF